MIRQSEWEQILHEKLRFIIGKKVLETTDKLMDNLKENFRNNICSIMHEIADETMEALTIKGTTQEITIIINREDKQ